MEVAVGVQASEGCTTRRTLGVRATAFDSTRLQLQAAMDDADETHNGQETLGQMKQRHKRELRVRCCASGGAPTCTVVVNILPVSGLCPTSQSQVAFVQQEGQGRQGSCAKCYQ